MSPRGRNYGIRKICGCPRTRWPKCPHAWHFTYKPRGGPRYRFSLDVEHQRHIESKTDADKIANDIRSAINAGTFKRIIEPVAEVLPLVVTLAQFAALYVERASKASGKQTWGNDAGMFARFCGFHGPDGQPLGTWPLTAVTEDTIEAFHASLASFAASTRNQYVQLLKASFRWAARKGYLARSPISDESTLKRTKVAQRRRRVLADEEQRLLDAAATLRHGADLRLQWLIIAALEAGCRRGELLALQWADVNLLKRTLLVRAVEDGAKKTNRSRLLPISARLAAVLDMAKVDPAGRVYPPLGYVFGALGVKVLNIKKGWETTVLRAHGHEPAWVRGALAPTSRQQLEAIDLHFHDLRHEAGCRWLEQGWPIHHVQEMLGHANLSQTSTYLHASELGLQESMRRFDARRGKSVATATPSEHPPLRHTEAEQSDKDTLH